jgi:hypothetical protein
MAGSGAAVTTLAVSPAADVIQGDPLKSSGEYGREAVVTGLGSAGGATTGAIAEHAAGRAIGAGLGGTVAKTLVEEGASTAVSKALEKPIPAPAIERQ